MLKLRYLKKLQENTIVERLMWLHNQLSRAGKGNAYYLNKASVGILVGLLTTGCFLALQHYSFAPLETISSKSYDYFFKLRGSVPPPENIIIAAIDENSLAKLGRWPWSRDKLSLLVNILSEAGTELIVFDIILSEEEANDSALAESFRNAGNVILPVVFRFDQDKSEASEHLINSAIYSIENPENFSRYPPPIASDAIIPVPTLLPEALAFGHINMFADKDGTLRREGLIINYDGYFFPSLALTTASLHLGIPPMLAAIDAGHGVSLNNTFIPTDPWERMLIYYYGKSNSFPHLSISDILDGKIPPEQLRNKIVLVGATASGIYDLRVTPFTPEMSGIEKQANVIAGIIEKRFIRPAGGRADFIFLLIPSLLLTVLVAGRSALSASIISLLFLLSISCLSYFLFVQKGIWISPVYPLFNTLFVLGGVTTFNYAVEESKARKIRTLFSSYVSERVVNELVQHPEMAKLGGDRREITILFSDLRSFTTFSEKYTPEEVVSVLNEYLSSMTDIVFKWEGTLDKFIGDAIMAFWGAPLPQEDHSLRAVNCALEMLSELEHLNRKWESEGMERLACGIGINTGEVLVGNIGSEKKKMDYTVIGDHVNLASRVESLTKKYMTPLLITETTLSAISSFLDEGLRVPVQIKGEDLVAVKGKQQAVKIYTVKPLRKGASSKVIECTSNRILRLKEK